MVTIICGGNTFQTDDNVVLIGKNNKRNAIVIGSFRPIENPIVWVNVKNEKGFLNANILDADGEVVLRIEDNIAIINKDNIYEVKTIPDNQIPPDRVIVINKYGETALDLSYRDGVILVNVDLYDGKDHIVANEKGIIINPDHPMV